MAVWRVAYYRLHSSRPAERGSVVSLELTSTLLKFSLGSLLLPVFLSLSLTERSGRDQSLTDNETEPGGRIHIHAHPGPRQTRYATIQHATAHTSAHNGQAFPHETRDDHYYDYGGESGGEMEVGGWRLMYCWQAQIGGRCESCRAEQAAFQPTSALAVATINRSPFHSANISYRCRPPGQPTK